MNEKQTRQRRFLTGFTFNKEMGQVLQSMRKKARLTQDDVAQRIGIKSKSGQSFVAQLENGLIKNPSMGTIFNYLIACNADWRVFAEKIHQIWSKEYLKEILPATELPSNAKIGKKIDRDTSLFATKIAGIPKPLDKGTLKDRVIIKVRMFLTGHKTEASFIPTYLDYADKVFEREISQNPGPVIDEKQFIRSGIRPILFRPIRRIVIDTIRTEQKRLERTKPITSEKQRKMVTGYLQFRKIIEPIEAEVHQLLNELKVKEVLYLSYKNYARECYKQLKKYYGKDEPLLTQHLAEITRGWTAAGLDESVLEKVKEIVIMVYKKLQPVSQ